MSVATAITALSGRIQDAYTACEAKGATMPATRNTTNLPATIDSIQGGASGEPINKFIYYAGAADGVTLTTSNVTGTMSVVPSGVSYSNLYYLYVGEGTETIARELF